MVGGTAADHVRSHLKPMTLLRMAQQPGMARSNTVQLPLQAGKSFVLMEVLPAVLAQIPALREDPPLLLLIDCSGMPVQVLSVLLLLACPDTSAWHLPVQVSDAW